MKIADSQKIRVISGHVCFYTTAKQIRDGVGDFGKFNLAMQMALGSLERGQSKQTPIIGISGLWEGFDIQLNLSEG